ncbi:MAG: rod shape-determining protein MreD [Candidatus Berkelbacteria bacterium Licking1014_7]|uniref:Rod shape-determining protein MreD n=1 Tax=Candidatus Berkelbacteria bacterium Licking1014_7 TaxID=2017147 RepID=A0A554LIS9_9BACT|nr:MAG: rod shape-determining protein MreD [Candidatus Berkelbacteria bacterium Licking1014_7]
MKQIIILLLAFVAIMTQVSVFSRLSILSNINIFLLTMIFLIFLKKENQALWWAGFGGVFLDIFSGLRFGIYTLIMICLWWLAMILRNKYFSQNLLSIIWIIFLAQIIFSVPTFILDISWWVFLETIFVNIAIAILLYLIFSKKINQ